MGMEPLVAVDLEGIIGISGNQHKLAQTLRAELVTKLMSMGSRSYDPQSLVRACLRTVSIVENLTESQRTAIAHW